MIELSAALGVLLVALGTVLTPGPNTVHLASRAISQGRRAGLVSLAGTAVGFLCYLLAATAGLSALFAAVPAAHTAVRTAGALYVQIAVAVTVNGLIVLTAAALARFLAARPRVMTAQRRATGGLLGAFAVRTALEPAPARP